MKTVTHGLLCVLLLFFAAGLCAAQSAENTLVDTLHEIDEAARSAVKALGEAHDEFVRGSRTEYGDNEVKFKMSKEPTGGEWHCLPPANWLNVFDFSFRFVKTAVFNITTSEWGDRKGFMRIDVSRDSNVFCSTWKSFHPALPKFDLSKFQITWTMLTKEPVSARDVLESILLNFFSQGTADWITSIFGMCSECSKDAETLGGCGHMPEHCAEWGSQKYRECNIRDFPTNIGTLSCDGDAGWCAVDVGPWNNVCVRVQDLSPLGKGEDHTYSIGMHTHFDLKYAINFFVGILFVSQAAWVAEQRHIHYVIGYVFVFLARSSGTLLVWLKLSGDAGSLVSIARQHSFLYHHCKDDYIMLTRWLPEDVPNKIPAYGTHQVGVGGLVLDKDGRILLVKERGGLPGVSWKLPGGLTDSGEDFGDAACREVFEETGIECEFRNILCFRHQHGLGFGKSDLYAICYLQANRSLDIDFDPVEIEAATWMPLQDFAKTTKHPMMKKVFDMFLPSRSNKDITVGVPLVETEMRYLKNRPPFKFYMAEQEWKRSGGNRPTEFTVLIGSVFGK
eukprot:Stramenopile-MAST_4_protein_1209